MIEVLPVVAVVHGVENGAFDRQGEYGLIFAATPDEVEQLRVEDVRLHLRKVLLLSAYLRRLD